MAVRGPAWQRTTQVKGSVRTLIAFGGAERVQPGVLSKIFGQYCQMWPIKEANSAALLTMTDLISPQKIAANRANLERALEARRAKKRSPESAQKRPRSASPLGSPPPSKTVQRAAGLADSVAKFVHNTASLRTKNRDLTAELDEAKNSAAQAKHDLVQKSKHSTYNHKKEIEAIKAAHAAELKAMEERAIAAEWAFERLKEDARHGNPGRPRKQGKTAHAAEKDSRQHDVQQDRTMRGRLQELLVSGFKSQWPLALMSYFREHQDLLHDLVVRCNGGAIHNKILRDFVAAIEATWRDRAVALRSRLRLSDAAYKEHTNLIRKHYDLDEDMYMDLEVDGVALPSFPALRQLKQMENKLLTDLGYESTDFGGGGGISLFKAVKRQIELRAITEKKIIVQFSGDGAMMGKTTQTALVIKVTGVQSQGHMSNSPLVMLSTLVLYDGQDKYSAVELHTKRIAEEMQCLTLGEDPDGDLGEVQCGLIGGGDLKWINGVVALAGCNHTYACYLCEKPRHDFNKPTKVAPKRTWASLEMNAHAAELPFKCTSCNMTFNTEEERVASAPRTNTERLRYMTTHKGSLFNQTPHYPIEPEDWYTCMLHFVLRNVDQAFTWTVRCNIHDDDTQARVNRALKDMQIPVEVKRKDKSKVHDKMKAGRFNGRSCAILINRDEQSEGNYEDVLFALRLPRLPLAHAQGYWETMIDLFDVALETFDEPTDMLSTDAHVLEKRERWAQKIQRHANAYMEAMLKVVPHDRVGLYPHFATDHLADMVRRIGSQSRLSMQGEEHAHSLRNRDRKGRASHKMEGAATRKNKDGTKGTTKVGKHETQLRTEVVRQVATFQVATREPYWRRSKARQQLCARALSASTLEEEDPRELLDTPELIDQPQTAA